MDEELRELEAEGVIEKLVTSEWAALIVAPVKKDDNVRVCGDFKVTINPQLEVDVYLFPALMILMPAQVGVHCSASFTCVTLTYKWRLRSTPGHSSP